jgi:hypothetical protein
MAVILLSGTATGFPGTAAQEPDMPKERLEVGDHAPDFEIPSTVPVPEGGTTVSVSALIEGEQAVVIAFFPKAFTGG